LLTRLTIIVASESSSFYFLLRYRAFLLYELVLSPTLLMITLVPSPITLSDVLNYYCFNFAVVGAAIELCFLVARLRLPKVVDY